MDNYIVSCEITLKYASNSQVINEIPTNHQYQSTSSCHSILSTQPVTVDSGQSAINRQHISLKMHICMHLQCILHTSL